MNKKIKTALKTNKAITLEEAINRLPDQRKKKIFKGAFQIVYAMELRELRKKKKLTQQELAEKMKVKREHVSALESGRENITAATIDKIAQATNTYPFFTFVS